MICYIERGIDFHPVKGCIISLDILWMRSNVDKDDHYSNRHFKSSYEVSAYFKE